MAMDDEGAGTDGGMSDVGAAGPGAGTEQGLGAGNISRASDQGGGTAGEMTDAGTPGDAGQDRDAEGSGVDATPGLGGVGAGDPGGLDPMAPIVCHTTRGSCSAGIPRRQSTVSVSAPSRTVIIFASYHACAPVRASRISTTRAGLAILLWTHPASSVAPRRRRRR